MKRIIISIYLLLIGALGVYAQADSIVVTIQKDDMKTIFSLSKIKSVGAYVNVGMGVSSIGNADLFESNNTFACIINHKHAIGMTMSNFTADFNFTFSNEDLQIASEYEGKTFGLFYSPIFFHKKPIHFTIPLRIEAGNVNAKQYYVDSTGTRFVDARDKDGFLLLKPGVEVEFNLLKYLRLAVYAQYQYALGLNLNHNNSENKNKNALNGLNLGLNLKFGVF